MNTERLRGEKWREFRFSGYRGEHCGQASFGLRHDSSVVRLSGHAAKTHWEQLCTMSTNVTRIDLQVTLWMPEGPSLRLARHHEELVSQVKPRGRPPQFKFWYGPRGPEACTIGSRKSDVFFRIYDKGVESRLPEFRDCLRYEVELKRKESLGHAKRLMVQQDQAAYISQCVSKFVTVRKAQIPPWFNLSRDVPPSAGDSILCVREDSECKHLLRQVPEYPTMREHPSSRLRKRSMWLAMSVRPVVQELIAHGEVEAVQDALGITSGPRGIEASHEGSWATFNKWR